MRSGWFMGGAGSRRGFLAKFMKYVNGLTFEEEPDYNYLREIVTEVSERI